jgi:hypothetical protein
VPKFVLKPPTITAYQFTGESDSVTLISGWLSSYGKLVSWDPTQNQLIIRESAEPNAAIVIADSGDWVGMGSAMMVSIIDDLDYYDEVPDEPVVETPVEGD